MRKYIAATLSLAVAIGPASALDLGLGGKAGGVGVGTSVGVGSKGASVGVGASVGGIGRADAGASVNPNNGSTGASLGGKVSGASGGVSAGVGAGSGSSIGVGTSAASRSTAGGTSAASGTTAKGSAAGAGSAGVGGIGTKTVIGPAAGVRHSIALPPILLPSRSGHDKSVPSIVGYPLRTRALLRAKPGTPSAVVRVCRSAIVSAATPHGAVLVQAVSAGPLSRQPRGALSAPVEVRIDYARQGGIEVRQARIRCRLDAAGRVIAVL
jgi:hypothetical protein